MTDPILKAISDTAYERGFIAGITAAADAFTDPELRVRIFRKAIERTEVGPPECIAPEAAA